MSAVISLSVRPLVPDNGIASPTRSFGDRNTSPMTRCPAARTTCCGRWEGARKLAAKTLRIFPGDGSTLFYQKLCERYLHNPPGDTWDGIIELEPSKRGHDGTCDV